MTRFKYEPDYAVPPGATLQETIDGLGIDQRELAVRTGLSAKHINQVIKGDATITHDTAIRLERITGVPARMWNNLEANYREQLARLAQRKRLEDDLEWLSTIPTKELIARGIIAETEDQITLLESVLSVFGVASVDAWKEGWTMPQFAFRKSLAFDGKIGAMATWLRLGELEAHKVECQPYDRSVFRKNLDEIRKLTLETPKVFVQGMTELCSNSGVALALVPEIKRAPVSGAAKWLTPNRAMICLNLRGKCNDRFWFTFFHEAGHVLEDSKKETYIDVDYADDPRERNANQFAATILIPAEFDKQLRSLTTYDSVLRFAARIRVDPGIVVGRLQCEKIIRYDQFNGLEPAAEVG